MLPQWRQMVRVLHRSVAARVLRCVAWYHQVDVLQRECYSFARSDFIKFSGNLSSKLRRVGLLLDNLRYPALGRLQPLTSRTWEVTKRKKRNRSGYPINILGRALDIRMSRDIQIYGYLLLLSCFKFPKSRNGEFPAKLTGQRNGSFTVR